MNRYKIAVIEGDGIGREVAPEGLRVLEAAGRRCDIASEDRRMPEDGLDQLRGFDVIYFGAVGYPLCPGPYFVVGFVDPPSARVSAVRQPVAGASAPRH